MKRQWQWTACVLFSTVWAPALATPAAPESPSSKATFLAIPVDGGVVVRNVSAAPLLMTMHAPDLGQFPNTMCPAPFNYDRLQPQAHRFTLPPGTSTCLAVADRAVVPLTLRSVNPFHQVHLTAMGVSPDPALPVTVTAAHGLALYAARTSTTNPNPCVPPDVTTVLVSTTGNAATLCLTAYGGFRHALTPLSPGVYSGTLMSAKLRTAAGDAVPVTVTVRGSLWWASVLLGVGVLAGMLLPFLQDTSSRARRRRAALAEVGLTASDDRARAGPYVLFRSGNEQLAISTNLLSAPTDANFQTDLDGVERFFRARTAYYDLLQRVKDLQATWPNWTPPIELKSLRKATWLKLFPPRARPIPGSSAAAIEALQGVLMGKANFLDTEPQTPIKGLKLQTKAPVMKRRFTVLKPPLPVQKTIYVNWAQATALASTLEEALRLASALKNLDIKHYIAQRDNVSAKQLVKLLYQEEALAYSAEDLKAYRVRLEALRTAADAPPDSAKAVGFRPSDAGAPAAALPAPFSTQAAPEAWVALRRTQATSWGLILTLSLVIAISSGLFELYVGRPWGASAWDYLKAVLWGAGTGVATVIAANLVQALSGSAVLGALVKKVKL